MGFDFAAFNFIDYGIIVVLVVSGLMSTLRGMTREALGLAGWPLSILVAKFSAPQLEPIILDIISIEGLSQALAWAIPFAITVVLWFVLASLMAPGLKRAGLGALDRWLGVIFGLIRGFLLVLIAYTTAVIAVEGEDKLPTQVSEAQFAPMLRASATTLSVVIPTDMRDRVLENVPATEIEGVDEIIENIEAPVTEGNSAITDSLNLLNDEVETDQ